MSLVQRTVDGQSVRRADTYGVMVGVGPDGSLIPIATDANGNVLMNINGTPGVLSDAIPLARSPLYAPTAGINPQGASQIFAVDAQGRLLVVLASGQSVGGGSAAATITSVGDDAEASLEAVPTLDLALPALRFVYTPGADTLQSWVGEISEAATVAGVSQRANDWAASGVVWFRKALT